MAVDPVSLAITAALTAANMAMTAMQKIEGPRVNASPATVADYGTPLNYFLGTRLITCPCFFAKPILEKKKKRKGKSGKQVTYSGYGSWAAHIADHEIGGVLQVWFDNHLVYDATGSGIAIYPLGDDYELEANMRIYLGTEAQDPDPDMEAYIEARDGTGTCPAYRGTSYIYFENIPLELLGNRFPDVKVIASQGETITIAEDTDIDFVGQQQVERLGTGTGAVTFALTDGIAATPAAGDFVMIVVSSGRYPLSSNTYHSAISGYTALTDAYNDENGLADFTWRAYYKVMGGTPDTTFTPIDVVATSACNAIQVLVFRGIDAEIFASEITSISGIGPTSYDPADIVLGGGIFDPGDIGGTTGTKLYVFKSFALASTTGRALPIVIGGACTSGGAPETVGNMLEIFQFDTVSTEDGARDARVHALFGREIILGQGSNLGALLTFVAERTGLDGSEYDFSLVSTDEYAFDGYNWTQATGRQICEAMCDLFDVDLRPHDFELESLPRGGASGGALPTDEFVANDNGPPFTLTDAGDTDLPRRVFLTYADTNAEQSPNVAMPAGPDAPASDREHAIDMTTLALTPDRAQRLSERWLRRKRFGRWSAEFGLTRQRIGIEPGDVWTPAFDGEAMVKRCTKLVYGADGRIVTEWERDDPAINALPGSEGAGAAGYIPDAMPEGIDTLGLVMDLPYLVDAHDQSAPLAYLVAGPEEAGTWPGADFAQSDTGELDSYTVAWDGIAEGDGSIIGACTAALPDALPWLADMGSSVEVVINAGELTAATLDELLLDETLNLAAIESGDGWELVQFMTPTLTDTLTYTLTGFLRGVRGTEWAMAGHAPADRFVMLENAKRHTLGASEIGDEDFYVATSAGQAVDQTTAFSVDFTGASHKPYSPVHGALTFDTGVSDDITIDAERRTRLGGNTLDGQDVPLGEASESWSADIYDGVTFKRTLTGTSLPLTYTAAQQTTDFGAPVTTGFEVYLYQVNPTLSLRGYELAMAA